MAQKLSQSPLIYVLGQIRISPMRKIEVCMDDIQDCLREKFPDYKAMTYYALELTDTKEPHLRPLKQWHFSNADRTLGILLQESSITIHTTNYECFAKLHSDFKNVLEVIDSIKRVGYYSRIGLRYINLITDNIFSNVQDKLLGFTLQDKSYINNIEEFFCKNETVQDTHQGTIKIQATHANIDKIFDDMKKNFLPLDLLPPAELLKPRDFKKPTENFVILDIDHFTKSDNKTFDINNIFDTFDFLKEGAYSAFIEAVTAHGIDSWR